MGPRPEQVLSHAKAGHLEMPLAGRHVGRVPDLQLRLSVVNQLKEV